MKYSSANPPIQCFMRQSTWYKSVGNVAVKGVLFHSTGAANPYISRYVQPDDNAADKEQVLKLLGVNKNHNDWNHIERQAGVHAFIGKLTSGEVTTVQVGEWNKKAWGCASGKKGSCNNGWIQFEICEDKLDDPVYFEAVYREAVELTAYLCKLYNLNPHGTVMYNGVKVPVILCHQDSYKLGLGSGHADVLHWFPKFGKSMDNVRDDVAALMGGTINEEDEDMTKEQFKKMFDEMRSDWRDNECAAWSKEARDWATNTGLIVGGDKLPDGRPNYMWSDTLTREQVAVLFFRFAKMMGRA